MTINGREIVVAAIDFDGTLFTEDKFPYVGEPIWSNINFVKTMKAEGIQLILYTNREGELLEDAVKACRSVGIEFDTVNENLQWRIDKYGNDCRKIGADFYFDDKAFNADSVSSWVINRYYEATCEKCGEEAITYEEHLTYRDKPILTKHCPHCGRYMTNHKT